MTRGLRLARGGKSILLACAGRGFALIGVLEIGLDEECIGMFARGLSQCCEVWRIIGFALLCIEFMFGQGPVMPVLAFRPPFILPQGICPSSDLLLAAGCWRPAAQPVDLVAARGAIFRPPASAAGGVFGRPPSVVFSLVLRGAGFFMRVSLRISTNLADLSSKQRVPRRRDRLSIGLCRSPALSHRNYRSMFLPRARGPPVDLLNSRSAEP
ncbi:hypothetical protein GGE48_006452 [Rhizobium leguminosarum]|nr:hypothetical protein [Rhizobium leguminosarum]